MDVAKENTNNANIRKKSVRIAVTTSDLGKLLEITQLMTWEAQSAFRRANGQMLDLLLISVETPILSAISQFWNSSTRAFEKLELDIVPTIEEYSQPNSNGNKKRGSCSIDTLFSTTLDLHLPLRLKVSQDVDS
ncbi:hypothetical protein PIB30_076228 [Stylosanthes scabra]|uniref:DUF7745 domain-containing protein n=1 Tax=Stylosanthes scabra TaxID=79078 RepID=A0ABU6VNN2_9FABA|nr:hypothetical protein [Stylosanthes scabra]